MKNEEYRKWGESAYYWNLYRKKIEQIYAPITEAILSRAEIAKDHRVLDIGGGAGEPSLSIKERTGAKVFYSDPAIQMAAFAEKEAKSRNLQDMHFCTCSGDQLPFPNRTFDRIVSRLSIMFIPDTSRAIREMIRVTKPNGKITVAFWNESSKNPMHSVPTDALKSFLPADPQPPDPLGPFRFAEAETLSNQFKQAGLVEVEETPVDFEISAIRSIDEFWEIRSQMSESLRDKMARLPNERREQAITAAKSAVSKFLVGDRLNLPASVRVITAVVS